MSADGIFADSSTAAMGAVERARSGPGEQPTLGIRPAMRVARTTGITSEPT